MVFPAFPFLCIIAAGAGSLAAPACLFSSPAPTLFKKNGNTVSLQKVK